MLRLMILGDKMGLTTKKEEQLKQMPLIRTRITKTKDGRFVVHRTEIIHVKPTAYYEAVLRSDESVTEDSESLEAAEA